MANRSCLARIAVCYLVVFASIARAQPYGGVSTPNAAPAIAGTATRAPTGPTTTPTAFKPEELEQIAAPIALYPDSLLAQVLMASTYPLEVVQADRWAKANPKGKDSPAELNKLTWDPSVKSLLNFPQVLAMMSEKLDWTVKLGDAFIADQKAIMDAVQRLRNKAYAKGNLKSNEQQKVNVQNTVATATQPAAQVIVVESSSPSVVYVPTYNPTVVYGGWPYPSYPPYSYYPPGYVAGTALLSFGVGVACGAAWGNAWGNCNWNGGDVEIDIDKNVNFNNNIDREKYKAERDARQTDRQGSRDTRQGDRQTNRQGGKSSFQHDPSHRQGVAYRDAGTTERMRGAGASQTTAQARDAYRGRAETGRQDIARGGADAYRGQTSAARTPAARPANTGTRSSGFGGADSSGASARASSSRGQTSRSSPTYSSSRSGGGSSGGSRGGGYSGGSRSSGGGSRGGGGGRSGGGGRR